MDRKQFVVFVVLMGLFIGCQSVNEKANKLFVETTLLSKNLPMFLLEKDVLDLIVTKLDFIIENYPESDTAVKLLQGNLMVAGEPYDSLKMFAGSEDLESLRTTIGGVLKEILEKPLNE